VRTDHPLRKIRKLVRDVLGELNRNLSERRPVHGAFQIRDDGEASRSLFDAVAEMPGLMPVVRELEARLAADAE
jgi:hypothetical protein